MLLKMSVRNFGFCKCKRMAGRRSAHRRTRSGIRRSHLQEHPGQKPDGGLVKIAGRHREAQSLAAARTGDTVGRWMDELYEDHAKIKVQPLPYQTCRGYIRNRTKENPGSMPLNKLPSLELQKFCKKLLAKGGVRRLGAKNRPKGLSAKTVRNIHQILESSMRLTMEQKLIAKDPTGSVLYSRQEGQRWKRSGRLPSGGRLGRAASSSCSIWTWLPGFGEVSCWVITPPCSCWIPTPM